MTLLRSFSCLLLLVPVLGLAKAPTPAAQRWWSHVETLASDQMEGRDTGSKGYRRAADYVASKLTEAGVQPGAGQGFLQEVPFISRKMVKEQSRLALVRDGKEEPLNLGDELILSSISSRAGPVEAKLVFVGYGLTIPEMKHDDLAGQDLKGKIIVILFGGIPPGIPGNLAAHYGTPAERSKVYARAGVAGVLAVPNPRTLEVPWERLTEMEQHPAMVLDDPAMQDENIPLLGIVNPKATSKLFAGSGHTFEEVLALADAGKPIPHFALPVSVRGQVTLEDSRLSCVNVVGRLPGSDPKLAGESVVLTAHLDHLGTGAPVKGDTVYNGAMDNASGVAALLEVARYFQEKKVHPRRTVLFVAVTGEEKGLLGSHWFAVRPPVGSGTLVANLNMDMFMPLTPLKQLVALGLEESSLAAPLEASASRLGVQVMRDPDPEANRFIRSDQYSFIHEGVPALALMFGYGKGSPEERLQTDWLLSRYHALSDDVSQPVDREAAARFVSLLADLTQRIADAPSRPSWNPDSFFRRFEKGPSPR